MKRYVNGKEWNGYDDDYYDDDKYTDEKGVERHCNTHFKLAEARAEIERLKHIERCLREEFLLNTQNYPKEYHALFQRKFKAALSAAERKSK